MVDRYRDGARLFRLLRAIQGEGKALGELRQLLAVSAPTLRRDLNALRESGFVIEEVFVQGEKRVHCNATSVPMSPATAAWLLLTTLFDEVHGGVAEDELSALRALAASRLGLAAPDITSRFFRQPSAREVLTLGPTLETVLDATLRDKVLEFEYRAWGAAPRIVHVAPWSIARLGERLYVLGPTCDPVTDAAAPGWVPWRIDRIARPRATRAAFTRPADWAPQNAYAGRLGAFHDADPPTWVSLRLVGRAGLALQRSGLPWLEQRASEDGDYLRLDVLVHADRAFQQWLLRLGEDVEVLGPPDVRATIAATCERLARRYATDGSRATGHGLTP